MVYALPEEISSLINTVTDILQRAVTKPESVWPVQAAARCCLHQQQSLNQSHNLTFASDKTSMVY